MITSPVLAAGLALCAALGFALSTSLQHKAAGRVSSSTTNPAAVLISLLVTPLWVFGSIFGLTSWFLHALALNAGTFSLVQPIMLLGVVLAVFVRAGLNGAFPPGEEIRAVLLTVTSLIVFVVIADTDHVEKEANPTAVAIVMILALLMAVSLAIISGRLSSPARGARVLGIGAGTLFGVTAVLMKVTGQEIADHGALGALATWAPWSLIGCGLVALSLNQRAYQISRLSDSMPILNVLSALVAMLLGFLLYGEQFPSAPWIWVIQLVGVIGIFIGLNKIARFEDVSPATRT